MKKFVFPVALIGVGLQLFTSGAVAGPKFDGTSPACAIPVFNWSTAKISDRASANQRLASRIAGSLEDTQKNWQPNADDGGGPNGDLVGRGMYFEADPFSSTGYGPILTIAYLKPSQPLKDVRSLGPLDDPEMLKIASEAIRSNSPMILHSWITSSGYSDAVTIRAPKTAKPEQLPFDFSKTEVVIDDDSVDPKPWSDHALVTPKDTLGQALQKFTDRFSDLYKIWNADQRQQPDEVLWKLIINDIGSDEDLAVGDFSIDRSGTTWDPFDSCDEMSANEIADAIKKLRAKKLISADAKANSSCELKGAMIAQFKRSPGYPKLLSIYTYIQDYQRRLGIHSEAQRDVGTSSFSATCGK